MRTINVALPDHMLRAVVNYLEDKGVEHSGGSGHSIARSDLRDALYALKDAERGEPQGGEGAAVLAVPVINGRVGDWMQTAGATQFWPLDPRADEVHLHDIAHALSNMCRFAGHCRTFYSVAEHSVRVAEVVALSGADSRTVLAALMHDAPEAYVVDVPRPLKRFLAGYKGAEDRVWRAIAERFSLPAVLPAIVHAADETLLATEARDLMNGARTACGIRWKAASDALPDRIVPLSPTDARAKFMTMFRDLESM